MMKCPHCGSTAQVKSLGNPTPYKYDNTILTEGFTCGCDCVWEVEYERNSEGFWQKRQIVVHRKPKDEPNKGHIHCPCNGTDCPYWEKGICSMYSAEEGWLDPMEECEDFGLFWDEGDDYIDYD